MQNRRVVALLVIAVILASFLTYALASSPSTTMTLSSGIYPGAPSYTVYVIGSNYYAKDQNGVVDYSGTNAATVINNAFANLPDSGTSLGVQSIVDINGDIEISSALTPHGHTTVKINGIITIADGADCNAFENANPTTGDWFLDIQGGYLDGNAAAQSAGYGIVFNNTQRWSIKDVRIEDFYSDGVLLTGTAAVQNGVGEISGCYIFGNGRDGIYSTTYSTDHIFSNNNIGANDNHGIECGSGSNGHSICNNLIWNNGYLSGGSGGIGVFLYAADACTVEGNRVDSNGADGIALSTGAEYNVVNDNIVFNNAYLLAQHYVASGITIYDANNNTINGNMCPDSWDSYELWSIREHGTSDYNVFVADNCRDTDLGISTVGASTKVNLCWNSTTWIS